MLAKRTKLDKIDKNCD